jgi:hypothetical protein
VSVENSIGLDRSFATLRQFARKRADVEKCDLCSIELASEHQHLIEPLHRILICACDACSILFSEQHGTKYKRVPRRVRFLPDFRLSDGQWDSLLIPIELAFFYFSSPQKKVVAFYPSPAGATESLLSLNAWNDIVTENPVLESMEPDVEALLVNRVGRTRGNVDAVDCLVPIDECYKIVGLIRMHWRGFSGGTEVWREIAQFFADLRKKAGVTGEAPIA